MPSPGLNTIKEIGKLPLINKYADPFLIERDANNTSSNTYAQFRQRLMRPIDIFPVKFTVDIASLMKSLNSASETCNELPVVVDFVKGIVEYNLKLAAIRLCDKPVSGLRIWANNETQNTDGIQNNYKENKIVEEFNNIVDTLGKANEWTRSIGMISDPTQPTPPAPLAAALTDARHLSLPRIWQSTDYNPQLSLTVKLISPYGSEQSFIKNIAKPLLYLTALTAPSTYDGVTYGQPANVYVRAYGITFMPLAIADNFEVTRGGTSARVNWNKQPLEVSVSMSFKSAMPGFAAFLPPNVFNFTTGLGGGIDSLLNGALNAFTACADFSCQDPLGTIPDLKNDNTDTDLARILAGAGTMKIPGVTSLGSIIQSLRPTPEDLRTVPPSLLDYSQNNARSSFPQAPLQTAAQAQNVALDLLRQAQINISADQFGDMLNADSIASQAASMV
jgi:hypothetical protein